MEQEQGNEVYDGGVNSDRQRGNALDQEGLRSRLRVPQAPQALVLLPILLEQHQQRLEQSILLGEAGTFSR